MKISLVHLQCVFDLHQALIMSLVFAYRVSNVFQAVCVPDT